MRKKLIAACFRNGNKQELREFGATTRELLALADWLKDGGCEMTAMESTVLYWKPLYNILKSSGRKAMVVNARHMKDVSGWKTLSLVQTWNGFLRIPTFHHGQGCVLATMRVQKVEIRQNKEERTDGAYMVCDTENGNYLYKLCNLDEVIAMAKKKLDGRTLTKLERKE